MIKTLFVCDKCKLESKKETASKTWSDVRIMPLMKESPIQSMLLCTDCANVIYTFLNIEVKYGN